MSHQPPRPRVTCTEEGCAQDFARNAEMKRHIKEVHGNTIFCPFCTWPGTKRQQRYLDHLAKHHSTTRDRPLQVPEDFSDFAQAHAAHNTSTRQEQFTQYHSNGNQAHPTANSPLAPAYPSPSSTDSNGGHQISPSYQAVEWPSDVQSQDQATYFGPVYPYARYGDVPREDFALYPRTNGYYWSSEKGGR